MNIVRYQTSPFVTSRFSPELDQLIDLVFPAFTLERTERPKIPLDLYETPEALILQAELPGSARENIAVEVADGRLTVTVQPRTETKDSTPEKVSQEKPFSRSLQLPDRVNVEKIQARYENGLLTVTLPRQEETKPKQVSIEVK